MHPGRCRTPVGNPLRPPTTTANAGPRRPPSHRRPQQIPLHQLPWTITATESRRPHRHRHDPGPARSIELEGRSFLQFRPPGRRPASRRNSPPFPTAAGGSKCPAPLKDTFGDPIERLPHLSGILSARAAGWLDGRRPPGIAAQPAPDRRRARRRPIPAPPAVPTGCRCPPFSASCCSAA